MRDQDSWFGRGMVSEPTPGEREAAKQAQGEECSLDWRCSRD